MDEEGKLPLKRVELSLSKFNEVAIPHHLDLLRQHKANILKYEEAGDYTHVRSEQTHARRVSSQLRSLLGEVEALRRQVRSSDRARFDQLTQRSRDLTLKAIMDYLETSPLSINRMPLEENSASGSLLSTDSIGVIPDQIQLHVDTDAASLREREAVLAGWSALQGEVRALHEAWQCVQAAALRQRQPVAVTDERVEVATHNVEEARSHLAISERVRAGMYGVGGAVAGAALAGPAGLVLGAKAGAAALVVGSAFGYLAAALLGRRRQAQINEASVTPPPDNTHQTKKNC